ncbi:MAG: fibrinogen-related protein [Patescibacteria group bacterium]
MAMSRNTNATAYAKYSAFSIGGSATNYAISVSGYSGTAGDSLTGYSGYQFSTYDADHDGTASNCAISYHGAWWYSACHSSNLNGSYYGGPHASYADGMDWATWLGYYEAVTKSRMMVK